MSLYMTKTQISDNKEILISYGWDFALGSFFVRAEECSCSSEPDQYLVDIGWFHEYTGIDSFASTCTRKLAEIGIADFKMSLEQKSRLLNDMNGIGN